MCGKLELSEALVMDNVERLKMAAANLRQKLTHYAGTDSDAAWVLERMTPIFRGIENGDIVPPIRNKFRYYFANTDAPLFRYEDLGELAAEYSKALELWGQQEVDSRGNG